MTRRPPTLALAIEDATVAPLTTITLVGARDGEVEVSDGAGQVYFRARGAPSLLFTVGGAPGRHTVTLRPREGGEHEETTFIMVAETGVDDGGFWRDGLGMLRRSMGGTLTRTYEGRTYRLFVPWLLDQAMTDLGMRYFDPSGAEAAELHARGARVDGMIYTFTESDAGREDYYDTVYGPLGLATRKGGLLWGRQPVDNHTEAYLVECVHQAWRASGDDDWRDRLLPSCEAALRNVLDDPARFESAKGLLVRPPSIDMWDFQPDEPNLPPARLSPSMVAGPETKRVIFHGDNTLFALACDHLAEMMGETGDEWIARAFEIRHRTRETLWNGRHYAHYAEVDPDVERGLGDERERITLSNAYATNRAISRDDARAIIARYRSLREELPEGSPGEWPLCHPPYDRGFEAHAPVWEYMNGGVSATVAGELARGAFACGEESYGADVLRRVVARGLADGRVGWALRGAPRPEPAPPVFRPLDLRSHLDMALTVPPPPGRRPWMDGTEPGNDIGGLPTGELVAGGIPFVVEPGGAGIAERPGWRGELALPFVGRLRSLHLLHAVGTIGEDGALGVVTFRYVDGTERSVALRRDVHGDGWWFPSLASADGGIAWEGPNAVSRRVGVCHAAIENPEPAKGLAAVRVRAAATGATLVLLAATVSDSAPQRPQKDDSFGGPDQWPAASCVHAVLEGLAGVRETKPAMREATVTPRWSFAGVTHVVTTVALPASGGYVAYRYSASENQTDLTVTTSARRLTIRLPWTAPTCQVTRDDEAILCDVCDAHAIVNLDESVGATRLTFRP